jgi:hypothetical protein
MEKNGRILPPLRKKRTHEASVCRIGSSTYFFGGTGVELFAYQHPYEIWQKGER